METDQQGSSRRATAYHEAGHAVVSILFDRPILYVSIKLEGDSLGRVIRPALQKAVDRRGLERQLIQEATILHAGPEAEMKWSRRRAHHGTEDHKTSSGVCRDLRRPNKDGSRKPDDGPMSGVIDGIMSREARACIEARWPGIVSVARELLRRETLTHNDVVAILHKQGRKNVKAKALPKSEIA